MNKRLGSFGFAHGRHATLKKFLEFSEIVLKSDFDKDYYVSDGLAWHLEKYNVLFRLFDADYYTDKTPQSIALKLGRDSNDILNVIREIDKSYFPIGEYMPKKEYNLRYISSFVIDKKLGGNYDFLKYTE